MASLTIRNLDEKTKQAVRERAARNGRSMEEEVRLLLDASSQIDSQEGLPDASLASGAWVDDHISSDFPARGKNVLLIISGGIAAYKSLDLIRRLKERGVHLKIVMTRSATRFITPLSVEALAHDKAYLDLFSREDEHDIGHIRLARDADLIVVAPATANIIAKMANGIADDLATTVLLAGNSPILIAPAMNPLMWQNPSTRRNVQSLEDTGIYFIGPDAGEMAERGERGEGRLSDTMAIVSSIGGILDTRPKPLKGLRVVLTAGPTHEPIDPVRYIANRSSGKQGYAIAHALINAGADVNLISGPVNLAAPEGVNLIEVESAQQMYDEVKHSLPADIAIMVAAVADWRTASQADEKIKKKSGSNSLSLKLTQNPDILKFVGHDKNRPTLVIGFAAETQNVVKHAKAKLKRKGADWILANDVSPETGVMGGNRNTIKLLSKSAVEEWPELSKDQVAFKLVEKIIRFFEQQQIDV